MGPSKGDTKHGLRCKVLGTDLCLKSSVYLKAIRIIATTKKVSITVLGGGSLLVRNMCKSTVRTPIVRVKSPIYCEINRSFHFTTSLPPHGLPLPDKLSTVISILSLPTTTTFLPLSLLLSLVNILDSTSLENPNTFTFFLEVPT